MKGTPILKNKLVYLGLIVLEICKIVMYEFMYDYVKAKYREKKNYFILIQTTYSLHKNRRHLRRHCR